MVKGTAETPEAPKVEAKAEANGTNGTNGANGANGANGHSQPSLIWEVVGGAMVALWWAFSGCWGWHAPGSCQNSEVICHNQL